MDAHLVRRSVIVALGLLAASAGPMATAHAARPATGCPVSYTVMAVADLAPQGYQVPGAVDSPSSGIKSFGHLGNSDGLVCAMAVGPQTTSWGGQLYEFWDNSLAT